MGEPAIARAVREAGGPDALIRRLLKAGATEDDLERLRYDWSLIGRPEQLAPPLPWRIWAVVAGRGFGKSRCAAEYVREQVESGAVRRIALVGRTAGDVRDTMVEGESGLVTIAPRWCRPHYEPSKRRITWPNGAIATTFTADQPEELRGPEHDLAWADEVGSWRSATKGRARQRGEDAWHNLMMGLRIGTNPRVVVTTTPRTTGLMRKILEHEKAVISRGATYDNAANLSADFLEDMRRQYEGTRLGRQELHGELLEDVEGTLWTPSLIEATRLRPRSPERPEGFDWEDCEHLVVAVDPAVTATKESDETGIVVCGSKDDRVYVLADHSLRARPDEWGRAVVRTYREYKADEVVVESNQGHELLRSLLRNIDPTIPVRLVNAARGKRTRAEPIAALWEQERAHMVGIFGKLESQMTEWVPGDSSPDRLDAMVHGCQALIDRQTVKRQPVAEFRPVWPPPAPGLATQTAEQGEPSAVAADSADLDRFRRWLHGS